MYKPILTHLRPQMQFVNEYFFFGFCEDRGWQTADNVGRAKRYRQDHVRACAVCSPYGGEFFFFVVAYGTLYCPLAPSFSMHAASHATRAPFRVKAVFKLEFEI